MTSPPCLETARLALAPFRHDDLDALHRLFDDPSVRRYLLDDARVQRSWVAAEIDASDTRFAESGAGLWSVRERDAPAVSGFVGFRPFLDPPELQLLYGLLPERWGRGIATEAAGAVVGYAFDSLGFERVIAGSDRPNVRSIRVMERLGMRFERETADGAWGTVIFVVTKDEWVAGR